MTKSERRTKNFSSGIKKLGKENQNYIHKLTHELFRVEKFSNSAVLAKKSPESGMNEEVSGN